MKKYGGKESIRLRAVKRRIGLIAISAAILTAGLFPFTAAAIDPKLEINREINIPIIKFNPKAVVRWEYKFVNTTYTTSPAIGPDDSIYIGKDQTLYAFYPDGTRKWAVAFGGILQGTPVVSPDGTIYVNGMNSVLYAVDPNGTKKWDFPMGKLNPSNADRLTTSPAIGEDGTIYSAGVDDNLLHAVNPDGTEKWVFYMAGGPLTTPAVGPDGTIYAGSLDGNLYAIKPNGILKWSFEAALPFRIGPVVGPAGNIYAVTSLHSTLYALRPDKSVIWSHESYISKPAVGSDGTVYAGNDSSLKASNPDGTAKWDLNLSDYIISTPAIGADGTVYSATSTSKMLYAVNADGTIKWEHSAIGSGYYDPVVGRDGTVYAASSVSLIALGTVAASSVSLNKNTMELRAGDSETLTATVIPAEATNKRVKWRSSDSSVAVVNETGKVTGIAAGKAKITVEAEDGGFTAVCSVTVSEVPGSKSPVPKLTDIEGHPASLEIAKAVAYGVVSGYPDGTFRPDGSVTRAEFASMLMRRIFAGDEGAPLAFKDKDKIGDWAVEPVKKAVKLGIIKGYDDGTFRPNAKITHAEMISMVIRASGRSTENAPEKTGFADDAIIPKWAKPAVSKAEETGIIIVGGLPDGKFAPQALTTRAEAASAIVRMLEMPQ